MKRSQTLLLLCLTATNAFAAGAKKAPYTWKSVQIVGGGVVDGIILHPTAPDLRYARTDMGGAYKWDPASRRWSPILDFMPYKDLNLMGVESIALDPQDPKRVYLALGTYTNASTPNGAILRSDDQAGHFERTDVPIKFGGNEDGRGNGERLAVDPSDGEILYLGTRHDGLWRSNDRARSWSRVTSFPDVTEAVVQAPPPIPGETPHERSMRMPVPGDGIVFVRFAPDSGSESKQQPTRTIYVGVSLKGRANLFVSHDAGATWSTVPGEPTANRPLRSALATDGSLYITFGSSPGPSTMKDGAVWKLNTVTGQWTDITPDRPVPGSREFGYAGVSVDAQHPQTLIVSSYNRYSAGGEDIFRSTDGGTRWRKIFTQGGPSAGRFDYSNAPYVKKTGIHWLFDIEIDPRNSRHAFFTTGYGGWETYDLDAIDHGQPTHWTLFTPGIEEVVGLQLDSPTAGPPLLSAIGDYGSFTHRSLDAPAPEGASTNPRLGNTTSMVSAPLKPLIALRTGDSAEGKRQNIGFSLDGGATWQPTASSPQPTSHAGSTAVSADGATWFWTPEHDVPYVTRDHGATWTAVSALKPDTRVVGDPVDPNRFYAISLQSSQLFTSVDAGATFSARAFTYSDGAPSPGQGHGDERGGQDRLYATPGVSGDLWLPAFNGLYHLSGSVFERQPQVEVIHAFGFGKAAPNASYPALYLVGTIAGEAGIFRSIDSKDTGRHWERINDDQHQWGLILQIAGDPKQFGRVYVGTHGRGIFYGDPN